MVDKSTVICHLDLDVELLLHSHIFFLFRYVSSELVCLVCLSLCQMCGINCL